MEKIYTFIPKKTLILAILLLIAVVAISAITIFKQSGKPNSIPEPIISQPLSTITPLQKTIPGKTTTQDIEKTNPTMGKQILPSGEIKYEIESILIGRPNEMIFLNNTAKFERIITIKGATESGKLKISSQILKFGPAEKIIEGSEFYGARIKTYIYPSKGFAFIANTNADEIYEIQTFTPTTLDDYLTNYGEDIHEYGEIKE